MVSTDLTLVSRASARNTTTSARTRPRQKAIKPFRTVRGPTLGASTGVSDDVRRWPQRRGELLAILGERVRVLGRELHRKARIRVLDREREQVAAESGRDRRGLEELLLIETGVRHRGEHLVDDVWYPSELSLRLRNALWIEEHGLPPGVGGGEKHIR